MYQLDEEVEIATEYFYEMGLNEYGVNALIEELGVEEFVEWVYDIAESYTLEEETRLQRMSGRKNKILIGPKGSRPQSTTKAREKKQGGVTMRTSGGPKSTMRKRAVRAAAETQPETRETPAETRKGIGGLLSRAVSSYKAGAERHKEATEKTRETLGKLGRGLSQAWQTADNPKLRQAFRVQVKQGLSRQQKAIDKVAPAIGGAAGRLAARVPAIVSTYKAGERLGRALREDEEFEAWVEGLWEEGYDLSDYTWEGLYEIYEGFQSPFATPHAGGRSIAGDPNRGETLGNSGRLSPAMRAVQKSDQLQRTEPGSARQKMQTRRARQLQNMYGAARETGKFAEGYEFILSYLLDEGYADTIESAESIMNSMSDEWIADILES